jgi:hypothetical protein
MFVFLLCRESTRLANVHAAHSAELGIDADFSVVNLIEAENFSPEFLKLVSGN